MKWNRIVGLGIAFCLLIAAENLKSVFAQETNTGWKEVQESVWLREIKTIDGSLSLTYVVHEGTEWFGVTLPCRHTPRAYTVSWRRGDEIGVVRMTCEGYRNAPRTVHHFEQLFIDLPNGAPPAKPAEVYMEAYDTRIIV